MTTRIAFTVMAAVTCGGLLFFASEGGDPGYQLMWALIGVTAGGVFAWREG
jgi:hypothetical protein